MIAYSLSKAQADNKSDKFLALTISLSIATINLIIGGTDLPIKL